MDVPLSESFAEIRQISVGSEIHVNSFTRTKTLLFIVILFSFKLFYVLLPGQVLKYPIQYIRLAGDWDCVAAVERLPTLDFIFLSFGIMGFIVEL